MKILDKKRILERLGVRKEIIFLNIGIIILCIVILILNFNFAFIRHNNLGPALPVVTYVHYVNWKMLNFYLMVLLNVINIISLILINTKKVRKIVLSLTPIISFFSIILIITNPDYMILFPEGKPLTKVEFLELGGYMYIMIACGFILLTLFTIYQEGFIKKYSQYMGLILGVWFLSTFIHENGHAIFVIISGGEITKYAPLPFLDFNNFAGFVAWRNVPIQFIPLVMMGGEILQWIMIPVFLILLKFKSHNKWLILFLKLLVIVTWLDFPFYTINNTLGIPHWFLMGEASGDIITFTNITGFPLWVMNVLAIIQLVIGLIIIYFKIIKNTSISLFLKTKNIKMI